MIVVKLSGAAPVAPKVDVPAVKLVAFDAAKKSRYRDYLGIVTASTGSGT